MRNPLNHEYFDDPDRTNWPALIGGIVILIAFMLGLWTIGLMLSFWLATTALLSGGRAW